MLPWIPLRFLFRSRWAALAWCAAICWMAVSFAGGDTSDSANSDNSIAGISALLGQ